MTNFKNEILSSTARLMTIDDKPRFTLICALRKQIHDNLLLIIFGFVILILISLSIIRCIYSIMYKQKAKSIYRQLEKELKHLEANDDYSHGVSENDIIDGYRENMSEDGFKKYIMPYLENFRVQGKKIKKFMDKQQGKDIVKWQ